MTTEPESAQRAGRASRVLRSAARWAVTVVVVAALFGGAWMARSVSLPTGAAVADPLEVVPQAVENTRVCPGSLRTGGSFSAIDAGRAVGAAQAAAAATGGLTLTDLGSGSSSTASAEQGVVQRSGIAAPLAITSSTSEADIAALSWQSADADQVRGGILTQCASPTFDSWIAAGSQTVGRTTSVLLANPSDLESVVTLSVYTAQGQLIIDRDSLTVAAGGVRVLPLSAYSNGDEQLVVRVQASRAPVAAFVQQSTVRVLDAGGADVQAAGAAPARSQTVVGVHIVDSVGQTETSQTAGFEDAQNTLRLLATEANTTAHVRITGATTKEFDVVLTGGAVSDSALTDLPDGDYRIDVTADAPVVAAARTVIGGSSTPDFTWVQSATAIAEPMTVAVPDGVADARLVVAGQSGQQVEVEVDGATRTVEIDDTGLAPVELSAGARATVSSDEPLYLAISSTTGSTTSATALQSASLSSTVHIVAR